MDGLRIYTNPASEEVREGLSVFYSRRNNGPFYRWSYEKTGWSVSRVSFSKSSTKVLSAASWKTVPVALQRSIVEHYQD